MNLKYQIGYKRKKTSKIIVKYKMAKGEIDYKNKEIIKIIAKSKSRHEKWL